MSQHFFINRYQYIGVILRYSDEFEYILALIWALREKLHLQIKLTKIFIKYNIQIHLKNIGVFRNNII